MLCGCHEGASTPQGGKISAEQLSGRLYRLWGPPVLSEGFWITYSTHFALNVL